MRRGAHRSSSGAPWSPGHRSLGTGHKTLSAFRSSSHEGRRRRSCALCGEAARCVPRRSEEPRRTYFRLRNVRFDPSTDDFPWFAAFSISPSLIFRCAAGPALVSASHLHLGAAKKALQAFRAAASPLPGNEQGSKRARKSGKRVKTWRFGSELVRLSSFLVTMAINLQMLATARKTKPGRLSSIA